MFHILECHTYPGLGANIPVRAVGGNEFARPGNQGMLALMAG
jgi:hypothetical protein